MTAAGDHLADEQLMAALAGGRADALAAIYDRYAGVSYALALRLVGDRGAAEEVVQDAFLSIWQKAATYDPGCGRLYSWLLQIVRNRAIDELRRRRSPVRDQRLHQPLDGLSDPVPGVFEVEADTAVAAELRATVRGALENLPDNQLEVMEMAYFGGLSQREISERTGVPLGTVKTRSRLALKKLRKVLEPLTREPLIGL